MRRAELLNKDPVPLAKGTKKPQGQSYRTTGFFMTGRLFRVKDGRPVIEADLYSKSDKKLVYRHFLWTDGYATYHVAQNEKEADFWTLEQFHTLRGGLWGYKSVECQESIQEAIKNYDRLKSERTTYSADGRIETYECGISNKRMVKHLKRKEERIAEIMEKVPDLPKGFEKWMIGKFAKERYGFATEKGAYCAECGEEFEGEFKDGQEIKCPHCRKKLIFLRRRKKVKLKGAVQLFQQAGNRIIERHFRIDYTCSAGHRADREITEKCRAFTNDLRWETWYYGCYEGVYGKKQEFWDKKGGTCVNLLDQSFILHPASYEAFENLLSTGALSYIKRLSDRNEAIDYNIEAKRVTKFPELEYMAKLGLTRLCKEWTEADHVVGYIQRGQRTAEGLLRINKEQIGRMRTIDGGRNLLDALRDETHRLDVPAMLAINDSKVSYTAITDLTFKTGLNINRQVHFLQKCCAYSGRIIYEKLSRYEDYLDMAKRLHMNPKDEIVCLNKRWEEFHNRYIAEIELMKANKRIGQCNRKFKQIKQDKALNDELFRWSKDIYIVSVPGSAGDIIEEGCKQHHCVGASDTYMEKMAKRKSFIVFLRKSKEPEKPYYTIEVDRKGILQAYAAYDRKPDWKEVKPVLDDWLKEVKKRFEKYEKEQIPAAV